MQSSSAILLFKLYLYGIEMRFYRWSEQGHSCSNCTFMELKLLLLPLINFIVWFKLYLYGIEMNEELSVQALPKSSNCTFMELKFGFDNDAYLQFKGSNCTFMELKLTILLLLSS